MMISLSPLLNNCGLNFGGRKKNETRVVKDVFIVSGNKKMFFGRDTGGIFYFSVKSDGTTGREWFSFLKKKDALNPYSEEVVKTILCSDKFFKPTKNIVYNVAVIRGKNVLDDFRDCTKRKIYEVADKFNFTKANIEIACLVRKLLLDDIIEHCIDVKEIHVMHQPIMVDDVYPEMPEVALCDMDLEKYANEHQSYQLDITIDSYSMDVDISETLEIDKKMVGGLDDPGFLFVLSEHQ